jgi:hypothetical protein
MNPQTTNTAQRYLLALALAVAFLASACSDTDTDATDAESVDSQALDLSKSGSDAGEQAGASADDITQEDLTRFVAATEAALAGGAMEGVVLDAPEIYIAIAQVSCARFSQGDTLEQIVADHLAETAPTPGANDEQLIGAVLGAGVETICPEHGTKISDRPR